MLIAVLYDIIIQDGTYPVPPSWIVQEPQTAPSSCGCPCSSWVARVSPLVWTWYVHQTTSSVGDQGKSPVTLLARAFSFFSAPWLFLLIRYVAGWGSGIVNICVTFPVNKTMFRSKFTLKQMNGHLCVNLTLKQIQAATAWDFSSVSLQAASIRGFSCCNTTPWYFRRLIVTGPPVRRLLNLWYFLNLCYFKESIVTGPPK